MNLLTIFKSVSVMILLVFVMRIKRFNPYTRKLSPPKSGL
jgi:hypothetical protein